MGWGHAEQLVGSYFPDQGLNSGPRHRAHGVLTTGQLGNSILLSKQSVYWGYSLYSTILWYISISTLTIHWKDWCWSWSSNSLAPWCQEQTHLKRLCLMLWKIEDRRRRGWQKMRWLDGVINSKDMSFSKLLEIVKDREAWRAAFYGVTESGMTKRLSNDNIYICGQNIFSSLFKRSLISSLRRQRNIQSWVKEKFGMTFLNKSAPLSSICCFSVSMSSCGSECILVSELSHPLWQCRRFSKVLTLLLPSIAIFL